MKTVVATSGIDMEYFELKRRIAKRISWGKTFLDVGFLVGNFDFHYFFETPLLGRPDIARELDRLLVPLTSGQVVVSMGHERDGLFDESASELTTWVVNDGCPFTGEGVARYRKGSHLGALDGVLVASTLNDDWLLAEDPAEPIAVLATRRSLNPELPDPDLVFDASRFLKMMESPAFGFTEEAKRRLRETYGKAL